MSGRRARGKGHDHARAIISSMPQGVVAVDQSGCVILLNRAASEIFRLPWERARQRPVIEVIPTFGRHLSECLKLGTPIRDIVVKNRKQPLSAHFAPIFDNEHVIGAVGVIQSVPPEKKLQKEIDSLKKMNRKLESIIDSSCDGLFVTDGRGTILRCNKSSERLIGHKEKDILGKNVRDLLKMGYIDHSVTLEVLKKKAPVTLLQKLRNGKRIIVTGTPLINEAGEIDYVVTNERDISHLNVIRNQLNEYDRIFLDENDERSTSSFRFSAYGIVAVDQKIRYVLEMAHIVSQFDTTVLLLGESGVGKGVVAHFIHKSSKRQGGPFVKINCGAIPVSLVESELFGYRKGAFTGASSAGKAGLIEQAEGGTLFLDEICELPLSAQVKLLRVLEDLHITPVGGTGSKEVNVRIIAATNRDLVNMVSEGSFREDLYFRLNVVPIAIPPLRERKEDIPVLIYHLMNKINARLGTRKSITLEAIDILSSYAFPGNVRELENLLERLIILCPSDDIRPGLLPHPKPDRYKVANPLDLLKGGLTLPKVLDHLENEIIRSALRKYGSKRKAASALGVNPSTVVRKVKKHFHLSLER